MRSESIIRKAEVSDWDNIWEIFHQIVGKGETYSFDPDISKEDAFALWMLPQTTAYVVLKGEAVLGTYMMKPNQPGLGSHVANAGFMVAPQYVGQGVGRAMGENALQEARTAGYLAMQFNFVVSTNQSAVKLWKSLGFSIIGTVPKGFQHRTLGFVDVYIMHRFV